MIWANGMDGPEKRGFDPMIARSWGLVGLWIAFARAENLRAALFLLRWRSGKWRGIRTA